jgi:tetratricopeptide (TPR) repeat protein
VAEPGAARTWLDAERSMLVAVTVHAAAHGWPAHATRLSSYQEATGYFRQAQALARQAGDRAGLARVLGNLGLILQYQSRYQEAVRSQRRALAIFRETGDRHGTANTLNNLGVIEERQGRCNLAARHHRQAPGHRHGHRRPAPAVRRAGQPRHR